MLYFVGVILVSNEVTQLDRIEGLITQLIANVASLRRDFTTFRTEMVGFRSETYGFRDEMYTFRDGVNQRFEKSQSQQEKIGEQVSLIHQRLDHQLNRIAKVEEDVHILKRQG